MNLIDQCREIACREQGDLATCLRECADRLETSEEGFRVVKEQMLLALRGKIAAESELESLRRDADTAWLIEAVDARWGTGYFWRGIAKYEGGGTIDEAVRFSRKEDAERVIESLRKHDSRYGGTPNKYEACEHMWPDAAIAKEPT